MFKSLSFKKFQRRIRSPFALFKKSKKAKRNSTTTKHKRGPSQGGAAGGSEKQVLPETLDVPTLAIPSTPSTAVSSESDGTFPVTPQSAFSGFSPSARVVKEETHLPELPDLHTLDDAVIPQEAIGEVALKDAPLHTETVVPKSEEPTLQPSAEPAQEEADAVPVTSEVEPPVQETVEDEAATYVPESADIASIPSEHEDDVEAPKTTPEHTSIIEEDVVPVKVESLHLEQAPKPEQILPVNSGTEASEILVSTTVENSIEKPPSITAPLSVEPVKIVDSVPESLATSVEEVGADAPAPSTPVTTSFPIRASPEPQTPVKVKDLTLTKPSIDHSHSQPASPALPRSILKSPSTPRARVTSEGQTEADKNIMSELQASVRTRENKRLAQERAKTAEKERELRIKMEAKAKEGIVDEKDAGEVLQEVRAWRKQREASLKKGPDDKAKTTAYREAFAREEIMEELLRNVQDRSTRPAFTEDPAEKRQQLVLEELFANRGPILKA